MSALPQVEERSVPSPEETVLWLILVFAAFVLVGPIVILGSALLYKRFKETEELNTRLSFFAAGAVSLAFVVLFWPDFMALYAMLTRQVVVSMGTAGLEVRTLPWASLVLVWVFATPLMPFGAVLLHLLDRGAQWMRPRTLSEQLADVERWQKAYERWLSQRARRHAAKPPTPQWGKLRLGPYIKGDVFPADAGIGRRSGWLRLDEGLLDQHLLLVGSTGAGKTEAIKRLAHELLLSTSRDLFVVDGKGEEQLAAAIRGLAYQTGRGNAPIFRLGLKQTGAIYDGFRGAPEAVYSRLASMIGVAEADGDARYYADINRDLLQLICYAPGGPPRSFEELRARLSLRWFLSAWGHDLIERQTLQGFTETQVEDLARRLRPLARELAPVIGPEGFSLEDARCAVFCIRTQSVSDTGQRFLHFLVEDLQDFAGNRQKRPGVLVIDEFGVFGNSNILALLTLARSAQLGIILATQDVASLGDEATARLILANSRTRMLMATDFPEEVAHLAGTIYQVESSLYHQNGQPTGRGSARIRPTLKLDMDEVARLQPGEGFLIRQRQAAKLRLSVVSAIPPAPPEAPTAKRRQPSGTQVGSASSETDGRNGGVDGEAIPL